MNTTIQFIDAVKSKHGIASDYALAKFLEVKQQTVSGYRQGKVFLGDETAIKVAKVLEVEPASVLAAVHAERAKTEEEKAVWKLIYEKLGGIAAGALIAITASSAVPTPASAADKGLANSVYYVKSRRRLNPNPFLQILQPFLSPV